MGKHSSIACGFFFENVEILAENKAKQSETTQNNFKKKSTISGFCNSISSTKCSYCQPGPQIEAIVRQILITWLFYLYF